MRKTEIQKASDNELITEYVIKHSLLVYNLNTGGGIKQLEPMCEALENELFKRGIITEENLKRLRT